MLLQLNVGAAQWDRKSSCPEIQLRWKISYFGGISQTTGASPPDPRLDNCICTQFLRPRGPELSRQGRTLPFPHVHSWSGTKGTGRAHALDGWMDVWVDGWIDGWVDGWMDVWAGGWMSGRVDGWAGGWIEGWVGGWMGGGMEGRMSGWMEGRMGGWKEGWVDGWVGGVGCVGWCRLL